MHWRSFVFSCLAAAVLFPAASRAAPEVGGESAIVAVTVFPDRAAVVRVVEVSLPAGRSTLVIEDLPANLIAQSVRVRGRTDRSLLIGSVETKRHFEEAVVREEERRLTAELEALQDKRRAPWKADVSELLPQVTVPTLVLHCGEDAVQPFNEGRRMAAGIPGARIVALDGRNHVILEDEPAWPRFLQEVESFLSEDR